MTSTLFRCLILTGLGLSMALVVGLSHADTTPRLLRAAYIPFPPLAYTDDKGQASGDIIRLTEQLAADSGFRLSWQEAPINRIHRNLKNGNVDLWPTSGDIPALQAFTLETQPLGIDIQLCAYSRTATPTIRQHDQLINQRLILIRGYTYRGELDEVLAKSQRRPVVAPNHIAALELLNRGRGDYLIHFTHPMEYALAKYPVSGLKCDLLNSWPLALVISQQTPGAQTIVDALNAAQERRRIKEAEADSFPSDQ